MCVVYRPALFPSPLSYPFILFHYLLLLLLLLLHSSRANHFYIKFVLDFSRSSIVLLNFLTKYCCNNNPSIFFPSILVYFALEVLNSDFKLREVLVSFSYTKMILLWWGMFPLTCLLRILVENLVLIVFGLA